MTSLPEQPKFGGIYVLDTMLNFIDVNNSQDLPQGFSQVGVWGINVFHSNHGLNEFINEHAPMSIALIVLEFFSWNVTVHIIKIKSKILYQL